MQRYGWRSNARRIKTWALSSIAQQEAHEDVGSDEEVRDLGSRGDSGDDETEEVTTGRDRGGKEEGELRRVLRWR